MCFYSVAQVNREKVYNCIDSHYEGVKVSEVASELGMSVPEVRGHVTRLCYEGRVFHSSRSKAMTWRTRP